MWVWFKTIVVNHYQPPQFVNFQSGRLTFAVTRQLETMNYNCIDNMRYHPISCKFVFFDTIPYNMTGQYNIASFTEHHFSDDHCQQKAFAIWVGIWHLKHHGQFAGRPPREIWGNISS